MFYIIPTLTELTLTSVRSPHYDIEYGFLGVENISHPQDQFATIGN